MNFWQLATMTHLISFWYLCLSWDATLPLSHRQPSFISPPGFSNLFPTPHHSHLSIHHWMSRVAVRRLGKHNPSMFSINLMPHPNLPAEVCVCVSECVWVCLSRLPQKVCHTCEWLMRLRRVGNFIAIHRNGGCECCGCGCECERECGWNRHFNYSSRRLHRQIRVFRLMRSAQLFGCNTPNQDSRFPQLNALHPAGCIHFFSHSGVWGDTFRLFLSRQPRIVALEQQESVQKGKDTAPVERDGTRLSRKRRLHRGQSKTEHCALKRGDDRAWWATKAKKCEPNATCTSLEWGSWEMWWRKELWIVI